MNFQEISLKKLLDITVNYFWQIMCYQGIEMFFWGDKKSTINTEPRGDTQVILFEDKSL